MSTLAETYSLSCGVKLDIPSIFEKFFPLDFDYEKVVLIHASAGNNNFPAKIYDYFNEVVMLIRPELDKAGYRIYQIGGPNEQQLKGVNYLCGQTTIGQTAFLIKRCALLIGNDSMNVHIAGALNTPAVAVYGPTDIKNHGPYWKNQKSIFIESHRFGAKRPSYSAYEPEKTINQIQPESIANAALSILGLPTSNRRSLFFGEHYMQTVLDVYPDMVVDPNFAKGAALNIRMDYFHNEEILAKNLSLRKCVIVMDKPINLDILKQFKENIVGIRCKISPTFPKWIVREIKKLGIQHIFYTENLDDETVGKMRLDFFDYCFFDNFKDKTKEDFERSAKRYLNTDKLNISNDRLWFASNKYIISSNGSFISKATFDAGLPIENFDFSHQKLIDNNEFWKEQVHFYIYEK